MYFTSNKNRLLNLIYYIIFTWNWIKSVYQATMIEYKGCLKLLNQGTGGGYGLDTIFETWSEEKLSKYKMDEEYDHMRVSE